MTFTPAGERHALTEVAFSAYFATPFNAAELEAIDENFASIRQLLPSKKPVHSGAIGFQLQVGPGGIFSSAAPAPPGLPPLAGYHFERFTAAGSLDTRLVVTGNQITVNCLQYTRWAETFAYAAKLLEFAGRLVDRGDAGINMLMVEFIDQFHHEPRSSYSLDEALNPQSRYIPSFVFGAGKLWHSHIGWFEEVPIGDGRLLHQLNVDGMDVVGHPDGVTSGVRIHHIQQLQLNAPIKGGALADLHPAGAVTSAFDAMHMNNRRVITDCLAVPMASRIGLNA